MSNVYLAAIIRDYLCFFIKNTAVVGHYVYEHNPEGHEDWEALEKLGSAGKSSRGPKTVDGTAELFPGHGG